MQQDTHNIPREARSLRRAGRPRGPAREPGEISVTAETDAAAAQALVAGIPGVSGVEVVSDSPGRSRLTVTAGTGDVYELSKETFLAFAGNNTALCELGVRKASLEDIFLELTEGGEAQ